MKKVVERFLKYVKYDTQSQEDVEEFPSTAKQLIFLKDLTNELKDMGLKDVTMDKHGYVFANLHSNTDKHVPKIGFISHVDTSSAVSGRNVNPKISKNYDGKDILLNKEKNIKLSPEKFPELKNYIGQTIITTDGTTLLGADDKAGVSEIVTAAEYLIRHPEVKHGDIKIGFTPDEEVGRGVDFFDVKKFDADFAYTVDGGAIGELEYENFNAAKALVTVNGVSTHPGTAKGVMVNSITVAMEYAYMLPADETPENTEEREGFYHLMDISGNVEQTTMKYIIRDFDSTKFNNKKIAMQKAADALNKKYGEGTVLLEIKDQYYNMLEKINENKHIVETAQKAMEEVGVKPSVNPIRGGTDGAMLSFMGLPTPNLFTGGYNYHGRFEYIPAESMQKAVEVILKIIELYSK